MSNLFILKETFTNGLYFDFLIIISLISIICGLFVIIVKNPIVSVLCLIGLFFSIAIYLMMLGLHFIGLSYLLVYVGAVSILFLFILMLINVRISELVTDNNNSIPLAVATGIIFISTLFSTFPSGYKNNSSIYKFFTSLNFNNHLMKENEGNFIVITDMDNKGYLKTNGSIDELKDTPLFEGITNSRIKR